MWRTRELWGVGSTPPYLHDGRATTVLSAALQHGGAAASSVAALVAASATDRVNLVAFLENLVLFREEPEEAGEEEEPQPSLTATITVNTDWGSGYCASLNTTNASSNPVSAWSVTIHMGSSTITSSWNGQFSGNSGTVVARLDSNGIRRFRPGN